MSFGWGGAAGAARVRSGEWCAAAQECPKIAERQRMDLDAARGDGAGAGGGMESGQVGAAGAGMEVPRA